MESLISATSAGKYNTEPHHGVGILALISSFDSERGNQSSFLLKNGSVKGGLYLIAAMCNRGVTVDPTKGITRARSNKIRT